MKRTIQLLFFVAVLLLTPACTSRIETSEVDRLCGVQERLVIQTTTWANKPRKVEYLLQVFAPRPLGDSFWSTAHRFKHHDRAVQLCEK